MVLGKIWQHNVFEFELNFKIRFAKQRIIITEYFKVYLYLTLVFFSIHKISPVVYLSQLCIKCIIYILMYDEEWNLVKFGWLGLVKK